MKAILLIIVVTFTTQTNDVRTIAVPVAFYDTLSVCKSQLQEAMRISRPHAKAKAKRDNMNYITQAATCRDLSKVDYIGGKYESSY